VLTVTYPGGRTQQISVRRERVAKVRQWLGNYQGPDSSTIMRTAVMSIGPQRLESPSHIGYRFESRVCSSKSADCL